MSLFQNAWNDIETQAGIHFNPHVGRIFLSILSETWETMYEQASAIHSSATLPGIPLYILAMPPNLQRFSRSEGE